MKCYAGITLSSGQTVPCGQCMPCRINRGRKWTGRLLLEWLCAPRPEPISSWFVTLTYSEDSVPTTLSGALTLDRLKALKWIKNFSHRESKLRYFAIGEYGDQTLRPHLHLGLFSCTLATVQALTDRWQATNGHASFSDMSPQRAAYLCQYTAKKLTKADDPRLPKGCEPEFRTSSRNPPIGAAALPTLVDPYLTGAGRDIVRERGDVERTFRLHGKIYPLDNWMLTNMRRIIGIPLLHRERCQHDAYLHWHDLQEAEWKPEVHHAMETKIHGQKKRKRSITATV